MQNIKNKNEEMREKIEQIILDRMKNNAEMVWTRSTDEGYQMV